MPIDLPPFDVPPGYVRQESGIITKKQSILPGMAGGMAGMFGGKPPYGDLTRSLSLVMVNGLVVSNGGVNDTSWDSSPTISLSTPHYWRYVYVLCFYASNENTSLGYPYIDGVKTTKIHTYGTYDTFRAYCINVPTGTTAALTFDGSPDSKLLGYAVYIVYSPYNPFTVTGAYVSSSSTTIDVAARSVTLAYSSYYTFSTGVTEDGYDTFTGRVWDGESWWDEIVRMRAGSAYHSSAISSMSIRTSGYPGGYAINIT